MPNWLRVLLIVLAGVLVTGILVAWGFREHWDTGESVGVAALAVAVCGFAIAILEIRNATSAAKATKAAVARTLRGVESIELVRMIEQLQHTASDLEDAVEGEDTVAIRHAIRTWRRTAGDTNGALQRRFGKAFPALETLDTSIELARATLEALRAGDGTGQAAAARSLAEMDRAVDDLGPLHQQLLPTIDELDEHA